MSGGAELPLSAPAFITAIAHFVYPMTHVFSIALTAIGHALGPVGVVLTQLAAATVTLIFSFNLVERVLTGKLWDGVYAADSFVASWFFSAGVDCLEGREWYV